MTLNDREQSRESTEQGAEILSEPEVLDENGSVPKELSTEAIDGLRKERDEFYDSLLRKQAEFENYRRRVNKERADLRSAAQAEVLEELLPVLDSCEKGLGAMDQADPRGELDAFREGFELLLKGLRGVLERFGVEPVPGVGSDFDPMVHEAVLRENTTKNRDGEVLEEYRKGYRLGDRLLRPSQVRVAVHQEETETLN